MKIASQGSIIIVEGVSDQGLYTLTYNVINAACIQINYSKHTKDISKKEYNRRNHALFLLPFSFFSVRLNWKIGRRAIFFF